MARVTLKMLARKLDLSVSTVSKALHNRFDINPETRERVIALATSLNYQPNLIASSLRTNKTNTIAVIIPEIANNYFNLAINGIESVAQEENYHVLIYLSHEVYNKEVAFAQLAQNRRVDGVLISVSQNTTSFNHLMELADQNIPLVYFDRVNENMNVPRVTTNDFESGYLATEHLIKQGCKKIAHLTLRKNPSIAIKRKQGYLKALKDHKIPVNRSLILHSTDDHKKDVEMVRKLLKSNNRPDGIFAAMEKMAMAGYAACSDLGLAIPGDVKIIAFSNLEIASFLNPSLSTITQPAFEMGKAAAKALFDIIKNEKNRTSNAHIVLDSQLLIRDSTK